MAEGVKDKPELIPDILEVCKKGLKNTKQGDFARNCIKTIAKDNPDAVSAYLGITTKELQTANVVSLVEKKEYKPQQNEAVTNSKSNNATNMPLQQIVKNGNGGR